MKKLTIRKRYALMIVVCLSFLGYTNNVWALFGGGSGAPIDPFMIRTVQHLEELADSVYSGHNFQYRYFKLGNDIVDPMRRTIGGEYNSTTGLGYFAGHFDGGHHKITLEIYSLQEYVGLFGILDCGGSITDLSVDGYVTGTSKAGSIVGVLYNGTVDGCTNSAKVEGNDYSNIGGIVGSVYDGGMCDYSSNFRQVSNCKNSGLVIGGTYMGGIVGTIGVSSNTNPDETVSEANGRNSIVRYCTNIGVVNGNYTIGGIVGSLNVINGSDKDIFCCVNSGYVYGENHHAVGGIVGTSVGGSLYECINTAPIKGNSNVGGIAGVLNAQATRCYYDSLMFTGYGVANSSNAPGQVEGLVTPALVDISYMSSRLTNSRWIFDKMLYPRTGNSEVALLAASPILLSNSNTPPSNLENINAVGTDFGIPLYHSVFWGTSSVFGNILINTPPTPLPPSAGPMVVHAQVVGSGEDTLIATLGIHKKILPITTLGMNAAISITRMNPTVEKTNATAVTFMVNINPAPTMALTQADFILTANNATPINPNLFVVNAINSGFYLITVFDNMLGEKYYDNTRNSDTLRVSQINGYNLNNAYPNEFYDIRKQFRTTATLSKPDGYYTSLSGTGLIQFDNNEKVSALSNAVLLNNSIYYSNNTATTLSPSLSFSYGTLSAGVTYTVTLASGKLTDEWGNVNNNVISPLSGGLDNLGKFRTISGVYITKIERYTPNLTTSTVEKTNANTVKFKITFNSSPTTLVKASDFVVSNKLNGSVPTLSGSGLTYYLTVQTTNNTPIKAGLPVKITELNPNNPPSFAFSINPPNAPSTNQYYNVRKKFMADKIDYSPTSSNSPKGGKIILHYDEILTRALEMVLSPTPKQPTYNNNITVYEWVYSNYSIGTYGVNFLTTGNTVEDAWGNTQTVENWSFGVLKLSMLTNSQSESMNGNFAVSSIYPNPIVNEADFTVNTFEEGTLNVAIYDLSGSFVMNIISDKFMNANSELKVPMTLGLLSSGTYTVTITLNNDILSKQIIVVR